FIGEIFTPGFVLVCFGLACLASSLAAFLDFGIKMQIVAFIVGTITAFFTVRPVMMRYSYGSACRVRTNVDALEGAEGRVTEEITETSGRVLVRGDDWRAISVDGSTVAKDKRVRVVRVEGTKVFVEPI
ncbi:MAG: NfeD family protein, partial [Acidobacteriota bacterium]